MKPLILITGRTSIAKNGTPQWALNRDYSEMVTRAGGLPIIVANINVINDYVKIADGLLLSGGNDISTHLYGQEKLFNNIFIDKARDNLEWKLLEAFLPTKKPIFGICRGLQILNAYFGGTLYQDIPSQIGGEHSKGVNHDITIKRDSILGNLFGESMLVNSYHHQGIDTLAKGFIPTAWSQAGEQQLIEAFEHESLPIWAVQWHPERMGGSFIRNPKNGINSLPMFEFFINQCKKTHTTQKNDQM